MDHLLECAEAFEQLLDVQYHISTDTFKNDLHGRYQKEPLFPEIQDRIDPFDKIEHFFCRSFFQKGEKDYTKGQAIYTLLKKEKTILSTGKTMVQYDRLMSGKI